jgi:acyl-CoA dehydrogenase
VHCASLSLARTYFRTGLYREVPGARIPGGSEDVMLDLSVRSYMIVWLCPRAGCLQIRELVKNFKAKTAALKPTSKL